MSSFKDVTGQRFGLLIAIRPTGKLEPSNGAHFWECKCDCGGTHLANVNHLLMGRIKSCGCLKRRKKNERN